MLRIDPSDGKLSYSQISNTEEIGNMIDDIAYTYKADILCKTCGHEAQENSSYLNNWYFFDTSRETFREWLEDNPEKYDSDDYPKVFIISQSGAEDCSVCYQCGDPVEVCLDTCTIESCIVCKSGGA